VNWGGKRPFYRRSDEVNVVMRGSTEGNPRVDLFLL